MRRIVFACVVSLLITGTLYAANQIVQTNPMYPWPLYLISSLADLLQPLRDALAIQR